MTRWPIRRRWTVLTDGTIIDAQTAELSQYRGCALLGAAGLGKTFEIELLAELEQAAGREIRKERLADLAQSADVLVSRLDALAANATASTAIYLDALDEVMVPVRQAGRVVAAWLRGAVRQSGAFVRISCRSAIFPESVRAALEEVYQSDQTAYASLQTLSSEDVDVIAADDGLDAATFRKALDRSGAQPLAEQPLTLEMLLRVFRTGGDLPARRLELFDRGLQLLATERVERREEGTAIDIPVADLLDAAERLACFSMLSGRETVDYSDAPRDISLNGHELAGLPGGTRPLDGDTLRALRNSGLCERDGVYRFRFAHRQFPEYLAGRRLSRLLFHQVRAVLASPLGWPAGVAGPLRETAAFAAMANPHVAAWVAETDPEVVGLSDIADTSLRRLATVNLLHKLRLHELTDAQLWREGVELKGFQYPDAENDLRGVLQERGADCEDVLEGAIKMVDAWELDALSEPLADLVLDPTAPLGARESAGHALSRFGTSAARARIKPLIVGSDEDPNENLKGIALRCNYPDGLSVPELLAVLTPPRRRLYGGAYFGFLHRLDSEQFDATAFRVDGLAWARSIIRADPTADSDPLVRIARRIARAAIEELDDPAVEAGLSALLLQAARSYAASPLSPFREPSVSDETAQDQQPISNKPEGVRRRLFAMIVRHATERSEIWCLVRETARLLSPSDLEWLLALAVDESLPMQDRSGYAELARMVPWDDEAKCVDQWLAVRDREPAKSRIPFPLFIDVKSEEAEWERERHERSKVAPAAAPLEDQIDRTLHEALTLGEDKDPRYFVAVARLLTVSSADPHHYGFERFVTKTERWRSATDPTRARIVALARQLLLTETEEPENARDEPLNAIRGGYMPAVWVLADLDPAWLDSQPTEWWHRWSWYFVRELHPHLSDEDDEPKRLLLGKLFDRVGDDLTIAIAKLARAADSDSANLLGGILDLCQDIAPASLDQTLSELMMAGSVGLPNISRIARFTLSRDADRALQACYAQLEGSAAPDPDAVSVMAAVALLSEKPGESWTQVAAYLRAHPDLAPRVLGEYAQVGRFRVGSEDHSESTGSSFSVRQAGELALLLLDFYPPDSDPVHDGAFWVGPNESARQLRDRLIGWLSEQRELEAVEGLRALEHRFGSKYPGLRRPRATAERGYRLARWVPIAPESVAALLAAAEKRLIRSNEDALDAVVAAVEGYAYRLRHSSPSDLDDLWNRPRGGRPTPKEEERASDKICTAIREYFQAYAVTADREVQIFRRLVSRDGGGAPGSEVDVLCRIPATASVDRDSIAIPVEVKLSHNPEARDGMRIQLAARYMKELGTDSGTYVVIWMNAPNLGTAYKPLWRTTTEAESDLRKQAQTLKTEGLDVRAIVVDASLTRELSRVRSNRARHSARKVGSTKSVLKRRAAPRGARKKRLPQLARNRRSSKKP